ncbi:MAG: hypothetical protein GWO02_05095 [Gammaproteobacteria bacterium]|nr:hypothetical protein [Gammaproteobacteria bacterium]
MSVCDGDTGGWVHIGRAASDQDGLELVRRFSGHARAQVTRRYRVVEGATRLRGPD